MSVDDRKHRRQGERNVSVEADGVNVDERDMMLLRIVGNGVQSSRGDWSN